MKRLLALFVLICVAFTSPAQATNYVTAKGVQQFTCTIASGSTTCTATISSVGSGAFILYDGENPSVTTNAAEAFAGITLTNPTTITATRNTKTTGTVVVNGSIIDADTVNLIKSVQYGTVSISAGTSNTAAVTAPSSDANTAIHLLGFTTTDTSATADTELPILTQSGSTVTASIPSSGTVTAYFELDEFQSSALTANAVQRISATHSTSGTSWTAAITSVTTGNALTFAAGQSVATVTSNFNDALQYGVLTNGTTFTVNVNTSIADLKTYNAGIIEFNSGVLNSAVQRNTTTLTGVTSATTNLTTNVNNSYAGLSWLGNIYSAANADLNRAIGAVSLGNGTTAVATTAPLTPAGTGDVIITSISNNGAGFTSVASPYTLKGLFSAYNILTGSVSNQTAVFITSFTSPTTYGYCSSSVAFTNSGTAALINSTQASASNTTTITVTIPSSSSGNLLAVSLPFTSPSSGNTISTVTDNLGQIWVQVPSAQAVNTNNNTQTDIWYFPNTASGVTSVTITTSATFFNIFPEVYEFSNVATSTPVDIVGVVSNTAPVINDGVIVTKNTATANITGSWEEIEFPAFVAPPAGNTCCYPDNVFFGGWP